VVCCVVYFYIFSATASKFKNGAELEMLVVALQREVKSFCLIMRF
jgi:invasion protein IalB